MLFFLCKHHLLGIYVSCILADFAMLYFLNLVRAADPEVCTIDYSTIRYYTPQNTILAFSALPFRNYLNK